MAARWMAPAVAAVATLLAGCARLPLAERPMSEERFADAYAQLLPVAALMGATAERDPQWPLGNKAALVSEAQLAVCGAHSRLPRWAPRNVSWRATTRKRIPRPGKPTFKYWKPAPLA